MAAAAITVVDNPATIESDTTGAVITFGTGLLGLQGQLRNHGPADVWLFFSQIPGTAAVVSSVVTTGAQAQNQLPMPAGSLINIRPDCFTLAHKTAAGTAVLSWVPLAH